MKGVALRWRAATTVVLQGLLVMIFLISGISSLKCHSSESMNLTTPHKGNSTSHTSPVGGITNCSSAHTVCADVQLTFIIDKDILIMNYKDCASKELMERTKPITSGNQHFAIQFDPSFCFGDLCNAKIREVPKAPIKDEATGSNQCYTGFDWSVASYVQETTKCVKGYNQCYKGSMNITTVFGGGVYSFTPMIIRTCQHLACDVIKSQSFGPINITSEPGPCCSGRNCNWNSKFALKTINHGVRITTNPILFYDQSGSGFQGFSLQVCPLLAALGTTILSIWV